MANQNACTYYLNYFKNFIVLIFPSLIEYMLINKLQNTSKKRRQHQTKEIMKLKYTVQYLC